ncbi:MAG: hypothetical protein WA659_01490 [Candidatus Aquirickettsiella sp.]
MPKELITHSVEPLKKDKVIMAIDTSGSTQGCQVYWDTVSYLISYYADFFNDNVQYVFWSDKEREVFVQENKDEALKFSQANDTTKNRWGCTDPRVFIPKLLQQEQEPVTLIIITDGVIAPNGICNGKIDPKEVSVCIQECHKLLKQHKISFKQVDAYFLGVPKSMDLTVFAPFATALKKDAAWNLYLNGAKNFGVVLENLNKYSDDFDSFSSDFSAIKNYAEMETFKWRIENEESDVQSNPCFQEFEKLKENFMSKIKTSTKKNLQPTEETMQAYFKVLLTFKEWNEIKTSNFTTLRKELEELVANSGEKIQKIIKNREQLTI